jgi:nucleotide-binding universal stress UspA family protein
MYRHLMVPLDDSALSAETVQQAVQLARTLGAKVTFFHAQADCGASSIGALERVMSPSAFNENMAGEVSYRQNMPLVSKPVQVLPPALAALPANVGSIATTSVPSRGTPGAPGDTYHGLINRVNIFPKTALFDTATLSGELTWMQWSKVTQNPSVFKGDASYTAIDKPTKNFFGLAFNFTPTWFQVWPGLDLSAPLTWSQGISGNAAVLLGGNKSAGNWSAGMAADLYQRYKFQISYNGYFGNYSTTATGAMDVPNGTSAALSDRGWVSFTFKTTF